MISSIRVALYQIACFLAALAILLVVLGGVALGILIGTAPDSYGSEPIPAYKLISGISLLVGFLFLLPCVVALLLCRWKAFLAPPAMLVVSFVYLIWTLGAAVSFGLPLLPSALCLALAAVVRMFGKGPAGPVRVLTIEEVLGRSNDGKWDAARQ